MLPSHSIFPGVKAVPKHKPIITDQNPLSRLRQPVTRIINLMSPAPIIRNKKNRKLAAAVNVSCTISTAAPSAAAARKPVPYIRKSISAAYNPTFPAPDTQASTEVASPVAAAIVRALLDIWQHLISTKAQ